MIYKINGLKVNVDGTDELVSLESPVFSTKEDAMTFVKENISFYAHTEYKDTLVLTIDGVQYHYVELVPEPEEL